MEVHLYHILVFNNGNDFKGKFELDFFHIPSLSTLYIALRRAAPGVHYLYTMNLPCRYLPLKGCSSSPSTRRPRRKRHFQTKNRVLQKGVYIQLLNQ